MKVIEKKSPVLNWEVRSFEDLTKRELYQILHLRSQIFVVEQSDIYLDADNRDQQALHIIGKVEEGIAAYCRIFVSNAEQKEAGIGRVLVVSEHRGQGMGQLLIEQALTVLKGEQSIKIAAQLYLQSFYEDFGFLTIGKPYLDGSIEHVDMCLNRR